jgi:hypothetical protein
MEETIHRQVAINFIQIWTIKQKTSKYCGSALQNIWWGKEHSKETHLKEGRRNQQNYPRKRWPYDKKRGTWTKNWSVGQKTYEINWST